jgi:hypothetical protein
MKPLLRDFEIKSSAPQQLPPNCDAGLQLAFQSSRLAFKTSILIDGNDAERAHLHLEKVLAYFSSQF